MYDFVVEDGTGLSTATSYVSLEEATRFAALVPADETWGNSYQIPQQGALIRASWFLDERVIWNGEKAVEGSGLAWPRKGVKDREGNDVAENTIPREVKMAAFELARQSLNEALGYEDDQSALNALKVGDIELDFKETYTKPKMPSHFTYLLLGLGKVFSGAGGIAFKRIVR